MSISANCGKEGAVSATNSSGSYRQQQMGTSRQFKRVVRTLLIINNSFELFKKLLCASH